MKEEHINFNYQEIKNLLNELYDKAYEKGFNIGKELHNEGCQVDTRVGVIISEGGKIEEDYTSHSTSAKTILVEYIKAKLLDTLIDTNN